MQAWDAFLRDLEKHIGKETVDKWLKPLVVVDFDACNLYLEAQNSFQISWFEEHIRRRAESSLVNNNAHPIKIHFRTPPKVKKEKAEIPTLPLQIISDPIDLSSNFDHFVYDGRNELTFKFFKELQPGRYNPIFLYGPEGTGKTHLLMASAQKLKEQNLSVFYVHAETFTQHVVQAIRNSQMRQFREIYRNHDVLIIDDVHCLARKGATQEELFHTFNALHTAGRQIIFSSHLSPSKIEEIEARLISRFEWGIVLQLHPLCQNKMTEVLKTRAKMYNFPLSEPLLDLIIEKFSSSAKAMLRAVDALALRHQKPTELTVDKAEHLLSDLLDVEKQSELTPEKIISATAGYFGIRSDDILGKSQAKECTLPRKLAMLLCRKKLGLPYLTIGRIFDRDHSTVMASIKAVDDKSTTEEIGCALEKIQTLLEP
ncbi:MAG: ATP-binding protein [Verrucomicrobia bacterium]|nr:ATP-binding protein [Verrucomicrobiota bacterium]